MVELVRIGADTPGTGDRIGGGAFALLSHFFLPYWINWALGGARPAAAASVVGRRALGELGGRVFWGEGTDYFLREIPCDNCMKRAPRCIDRNF